MFEISVKAEVRAFTRSLNRIQKRQVPYATSVALNDVAFQVRKHIVDVTWPGSVEVKNTRFIGAALRVKKANKRTLTAAVFDRLGRASLSKHVKGGTKRPRGSSIAVPTDEVKRTGSGKVRRSQTPRTVLGKPRGFRTRLRSGTEVIGERVGSKRSGRVKILYTLHPSTRIRGRFPFYRDAERVARRRFPGLFKRALERAIATAR